MIPTTLVVDLVNDTSNNTVICIQEEFMNLHNEYKKHRIYNWYSKKESS